MSEKKGMSRRKFLTLSGAGLATLVGGAALKEPFFDPVVDYVKGFLPGEDNSPKKSVSGQKSRKGTKPIYDVDKNGRVIMFDGVVGVIDKDDLSYENNRGIGRLTFHQKNGEDLIFTDRGIDRVIEEVTLRNRATNTQHTLFANEDRQNKYEHLMKKMTDYVRKDISERERGVRK
ncbi:twin-arginine translocation signal domain-containing protein [Candidatus Woesearchaeota archaeon]|nr:twin-arginine translocation signal domain-containing protein [Candidatus Woesearchaeota archaeon]